MRTISVFSGSPDIDWAVRKLCETIGAPFDSEESERGASFLELARSHLRNHEQALCKHIDQTDSDLSPVRLDQTLADVLIHRRALEQHGGRDIFQGTLLAAWDAITRLLPQPDVDFLGKCSQNMHALAAFDTSPNGMMHLACVNWIEKSLKDMGFQIKTTGGPKPVLLAHRRARKSIGKIVMYNHYDTVGVGSSKTWETNPWEPVTKDERCFFLGAADNKGSLAVRLATFAELESTPEITWLIQGEEETGAAEARKYFPDWMPQDSDIYIDETGYTDKKGNQRILTTGFTSSSKSMEAALTKIASHHGKGATVEQRMLNKDLQRHGCPFCTNLPPNVNYVAIGVNDDNSSIHHPNESIPLDTWKFHRDQIEELFAWLGGEKS